MVTSPNDEGIVFPVSKNCYHKIEISINVFGYKNMYAYPIYLS